jgi:hypothetical protein
MRHARSYDFQTGTFKAAIDLADDVFGDSVGFDDGECAFNGHVKSFQ